MSLIFCQIRKDINELIVEKDQAVCETQQLRNCLCQVKDNICHMEGFNEKLIVELQCLDAKETELKGETDMMKRCIAHKTEEIEKECNERETCEDDQRQLKNNLDCVGQRNNTLEDQATKFDMVKKEKHAYICCLETKEAGLNFKTCEMKNANQELSEKNESLREAIENCGCEVERADQSLRFLSFKESTCKNETKELQDQINCVQSTLQRTCNKLHLAKEFNRELRTQIKHVQIENCRFNVDNFIYHQNNRDLTGKVANANRQLKRNQRNFYRTKCELESLKKSLEKFRTVISIHQVKCDCIM